MWRRSRLADIIQLRMPAHWRLLSGKSVQKTLVLSCLHWSAAGARDAERPRPDAEDQVGDAGQVRVVTAAFKGAYRGRAVVAFLLGHTC